MGETRNTKIWLKSGLCPNYFEGKASQTKDGYKIHDFKSNNDYTILNSQIDKIELGQESIWEKKI